MFGWFRRSRDNQQDPIARWRSIWAQAIETAGGATADELRRQLHLAAQPGTDVELEEEMLDALSQLEAIRHDVGRGALPQVQTQHRVVGTDACHFTAPASLPGDVSQASGRVLLTGGRSIFVGAGRTAALAWHSVHQIARLDRDVILLRADRSAAAHYRFNTFGDAVVAAYLAGHLKGPRRDRL